MLVERYRINPAQPASPFGFFANCLIPFYCQWGKPLNPMMRPSHSENNAAAARIFPFVNNFCAIHDVRCNKSPCRSRHGVRFTPKFHIPPLAMRPVKRSENGCNSRNG